jgi:hypothetical protein
LRSPAKKSGLAVQESSKERRVYMKHVVVFYEAHFLEFIHEEINASARAAHHFR